MGKRWMVLALIAGVNLMYGCGGYAPDFGVGAQLSDDDGGAIGSQDAGDGGVEAAR